MYIIGILDGLLLNLNVWYCDDLKSTYKHCSRGNNCPRPPPICMWFIAGHLFHTISKFGCTKYPSNADCLKETTPQNRNSTCAIEIHQLFLQKEKIMVKVIIGTSNYIFLAIIQTRHMRLIDYLKYVCATLSCHRYTQGKK